MRSGMLAVDARVRLATVAITVGTAGAPDAVRA
jgi:hypothetical protein